MEYFSSLIHAPPFPRTPAPPHSPDHHPPPPTATHRITDSGGVVANGSGSGKGPLPHDGVTMISDSPVLSHVASVTGTARCLGPSPMAEESLVLLPLGKYKLKVFVRECVHGCV